MTTEDIVSWSANITGIISFIISGVLLYYSGSIRKKIQEFNVFYDFTVDRKELNNEFKSIINFNQKNGTYNLDLNKIANLHRLLRKLEVYKKFMGESDNIAINRITILLKQSTLSEDNKRELTSHIQIILGFLEIDHRMKGVS